MRIFLLAVLFVFFIAFPVLAEQLSFSWTPNTDITEGYNIYETLGTEEVQVGQAVGRETNTITIDITDTGECRTFFSRAYAGVLESEASDTATWCPDTEIPAPVVRPDKATSFMITITPVQ